MKIQLIIASFLGFFGVALGAFGAHALKSILESVGKIEQFETANKYHWYHTFAVFLCAWFFYQTQNNTFSVSAWLFLVGIFVFSGSLYAYSITGLKQFAMITPVGGLFFLIAWGLMVYGIIYSKL